MPVHFEVDRKQNLLVGRATGKVTDVEICKAFVDVVSATHGAAFRQNVLFEIDEMASLSEINAESLDRLRATIESLSRTYPGRNVKTAIVAEGGVWQISLARLWRSVAEANPDVGAEVEVFTSEAEALTWLGANS